MAMIALPAGTVARLHVLPEPLASGFPYAVIVAEPPRQATPGAFVEVLGEPGGMAALLTHDRGVSWTDRAGETLLAATIERGGIAVMGFSAMADALSACRRVRELVG